MRNGLKGSVGAKIVAADVDGFNDVGILSRKRMELKVNVKKEMSEARVEVVWVKKMTKVVVTWGQIGVNKVNLTSVEME